MALQPTLTHQCKFNWSNTSHAQEGTTPSYYLTRRLNSTTRESQIVATRVPSPIVCTPALCKSRCYDWWHLDTQLQHYKISFVGNVSFQLGDQCCVKGYDKLLSIQPDDISRASKDVTCKVSQCNKRKSSHKPPQASKQHQLVMKFLWECFITWRIHQSLPKSKPILKPKGRQLQ